MDPETAKVEEGAKVFLIEQHYADHQEDFDWTWDRFLRLCAALQARPDEMVTALRWSPAEMRKAKQTNKFPGPVELHLTMWENYVYRKLNFKKTLP